MFFATVQRRGALHRRQAVRQTGPTQRKSSEGVLELCALPGFVMTDSVSLTASPFTLEIKTMRTADLTPHPLNITLYKERASGTPTPAVTQMRKSIAALGILEPIVVSRFELDGDTQNWILSGHRRWFAAMDQQLSEVPVRAVNLDGLEAERFLIESNRQRVKNKEQLAREFSALKRIEAELAKERQKMGKASLPDPASAGQARDKAAAAVGLRPKTAEKIEKIVKRADAGDAKARKALDAVNEGKKSVERAHVEVLAPYRREQAKAPKPKPIPIINVGYQEVPTDPVSVGEALMMCLKWFEGVLTTVIEEDRLKLYEAWHSKLGDEMAFYKDKLAKQAACPHVDRIPIKGKVNRYHCDVCGANFDGQ